MRRIAVTTSLAAAGLAAADLAAVGSAASAPAIEGGPERIVLHARSELQHARAVDSAPAGRSAGDRLIFTEKLLDARGRTIGHDAADCVALFDQRSQCTGTYMLKGGQVMVQLIQPKLTGRADYRQAITGGTGRYAGATGTVAVRQRASGDRFTFCVTVPRR
jgi:allene oxide cyclase-like protein